MSKIPPRTEETLVKHAVAKRLRAEIATGALAPGARIVEGTWGRRLGVAQGSIREAINILAQDGFVTKSAGRSARIIHLTEGDIANIFQMREVLEGLAARLIVRSGTSTSPLHLAVDQMRRALRDEKVDDLLDADLSFHLELCRLSGNQCLLDHMTRIITPQFAFARIKMLTLQPLAHVWEKDIEVHQRMANQIDEGPEDLAEQYVRHALKHFGCNAYSNWGESAAW